MSGWKTTPNPWELARDKKEALIRAVDLALHANLAPELAEELAEVREELTRTSKGAVRKGARK